MYCEPNEKQKGQGYGDCVIRAIAIANNISWVQAFDEIMPFSRNLQIPFNEQDCYRKYFESIGYKYKYLNQFERISLKTFCEIHPKGKYIIQFNNHITVVEDSVQKDIYDWAEREIKGYYFLDK
jgi:hypothetical protein